MVKRETDLSRTLLGTVHHKHSRAGKRERRVRHLSQGHALDAALASP